MSNLFENITPDLADWIARQYIFFVATAPLSASGHVNVSPKGGDSFRVLGPMEVAYQDYTGSGAETVAHLRENGRIVIMFCGFDGPPRITRLHGHGTVIQPGDDRYAELASRFPAKAGTRAIINVSVTRVSSSCGYAVPFFDFRQQRDQLDRWVATKSPDELAAYRLKKNSESIDGLPALDVKS
jgi:hypothetical protein